MNMIIKMVIFAFLLVFCSIVCSNEESNTNSTTSVTNTTNTTTSEPNDNSDSSTTTRSSTTTIVNDGDANIVSDIYTKYAKESALIGTSLTVSSDNGVVTINGVVTSQSQADEAVNVAKTIDGVKDVRSAITVKTHPDTNPIPKTPNY